MVFADLLVVALLAVIVVLVVQNRRSARTGAAPESEAARLAREVHELRARIQVLERVITDNHGSADLNDEIERLRDR